MVLKALRLVPRFRARNRSALRGLPRGGATLGLCWLAFAAPAAASLPNILVVTVDTLRADRLGAYGYGRNTTPHLDAFFESGVIFREGRTVEPLTAPALATMITGLPPHEHAATRNGLRMRAGLPSLTKILKRRGYATAAFVGNWTLRDELLGMGEHFEDYSVILERKRWFGLVRGEATGEDLHTPALEWLRAHQSGQTGRPFFLWVHYVEPHAPYELHEEFLERLRYRSGEARAVRYDTEVAVTDAHVGRLLTAVRELVPRSRDLLTVFTADHGESLGEHNYWGHGRHLYDVTLRIPLGFRWPGVIQPGEVREPALISDVGPTLLGLVGIPVPDFFPGVDWAPVLHGEAEGNPRRVTYYQAHKGAVQRRDAPQHVRQAGLLEVARVADGGKEIVRVTNGRRWEFDLEEDPAETNNLATTAESSADLGAWLQEVREGLARSDELPPPSLDEEDLEALRALGYIE